MEPTLQFKQWSFVLFLCTFFASGCNYNHEHDIALPEPESKIVIECYLEEGKPFKVSLTENLGFNNSQYQAPIKDAQVTIYNDNSSYDLKYTPFDYLNLQTTFPYNYYLGENVAFEYGKEVNIRVKYNQHEAFAKTRILKPINIDTIFWRFNEDSMAFAIIRFKDNSGEKNFYRLIINKDSLQGEKFRDIVMDDTVSDSDGQITVGTTWAFKKNQKIIVTLYHLDESYFDFLTSIEGASQIVDNPFFQPSIIHTNISGGTGIFTGLSYKRKEITFR